MIELTRFARVCRSQLRLKQVRRHQGRKACKPRGNDGAVCSSKAIAAKADVSTYAALGRIGVIDYHPRSLRKRANAPCMRSTFRGGCHGLLPPTKTPRARSSLNHSSSVICSCARSSSMVRCLCWRGFSCSGASWLSACAWRFIINSINPTAWVNIRLVKYNNRIFGMQRRFSICQHISAFCLSVYFKR